MTDRAALLAAVLAAPADDLPRLVYADWLDEHGEPERAEFIRVQIALARHEAARAASGKSGWRTLKLRAKVEALRRRERELWEANRKRWCLDLCGDEWAYGSQPTCTTTAGLSAEFRRGFVASVTAPLAAAWEAYECENCGGEGRVETGIREGSYGPCADCGGRFEPIDDEYDTGYSRGTGRVGGPTPALVRLAAGQPVERLELADKTPHEYTATTGGEDFHGGWGWHRGEPGDDGPGALPPELFARLEGRTDDTDADYDTADAAVVDLSDAILSLARHPVSAATRRAASSSASR